MLLTQGEPFQLKLIEFHSLLKVRSRGKTGLSEAGREKLEGDLVGERET